MGFDCTQHWVNTADQERILRALEEAEAAGNMALTADVELGRKRMHAQASALPKLVALLKKKRTVRPLPRKSSAPLR